MENIIVVNFDVESEAYQALSELRQEPIGKEYTVSQACVVKNENGHIISKDQFDTGLESMNDTASGSVIGSLVGIIGGPIGVLLGYSMGTLIGSAIDTADTVKNSSLIGKVCESIQPGETALIALVSEEITGSMRLKLGKFAAQTTYFDAAEVAAEVEKAQEIQRQMAKDARQKLNEEKKEAFYKKVEEQRDKLASEFNNLKEKLTKKS